jgi:EmrB/QacA subfamily drug resistance transporter/deazaflavin-dependent oxidoreductase (nitroreductase family)
MKIKFGPRLRGAIRFVARIVNPIVVRVAGRRWMPIVGVLHHQGRRSGRAFATPLGMRRRGEFFYMPRTFAENAAWYLNVQAAGRCVVTYLGADHTLVEPEVVDYQTAAPAFPRYERLQFRLIGIDEYLRMLACPLSGHGRVGRRSSTTTHVTQKTKKETQMTTDLSTSRHGGAAAPRNVRLALIVIAFAQLMVVLDVAIVNVALPSIQRSLHFAATDLEWVVNAYAVAFGGLLLLGGRAGDLFGRLRMFVIGTLLFTIGSLAGGLANTATLLIVARAAQGIGAAIMAPTALSLLADNFAEGSLRNRALGVYSAVSAGGGAVGLLLGGIITEYFSWRWILIVNVPIGIVLAIMAPRVLVTAKGRPGRLDLPGAITVTGGATLLVYGLARAAVHGWSDSLTIASLVIAAGLLVAFVAIEAVTRQPIMPLGIFANRNRSGAYALSLAVGATLSGTLFLLTLYLQNVLGFSPIRAGLAFLPTAIGVIVGAGLTSRLIGRIGPRMPMTVGALMAAIGLFWLSGVTATSDYVSAVMGPLFVLAVGLGQIFVSTSITAISGVKPNESGLSSALLNVGRQLGGSIGIAMMGTVAATVTADQLAGGVINHAVLNRALTSGFGAAFEIAGLIAIAGFVAAIVAVRRRPEPVAEAMAQAA